MSFHKFLKPISVSVTCLEGTFSVEYYFCNKGSVHLRSAHRTFCRAFSRFFKKNFAQCRVLTSKDSIFVRFHDFYFPLLSCFYLSISVSLPVARALSRLSTGELHWCDKGCVHQRIPCVFTIFFTIFAFKIIYPFQLPQNRSVSVEYWCTIFKARATSLFTLFSRAF